MNLKSQKATDLFRKKETHFHLKLINQEGVILARWKTRGQGPGVWVTGLQDLENTRSGMVGPGGKHGVSVKNTGSK